MNLTMSREQAALLYLLRISIGSNPEAGFDFSGLDWNGLVDMAFDEGVVAVAVEGLQGRIGLIDESLEMVNLLESEDLGDLRYKLFGESLLEESDYGLHCKRVAKLTEVFSKAGFRSCILKGLSNARLYPNPAHRLCGDIDIWVEGGRKKVLNYLRGHFNVGKVIINHAKLEVFPDVSVEVHYIPAWLYNPIANRRLQRFFNDEADAQFANMTDLGFATPLPKFNLVYNAVHIYKHYFQKEFNLKQLVDYYCILQHSSAEDRRESFCVLKQVGLAGFTSWLMGRLERDLGLSSELALCKASDSDICYRPFGEQICLIPWKLWHWAARKMYLKLGC